MIARMTNSMTYRRIGSAGLKVSTLSFGSWVTFGTQMGLDHATRCMQAAKDAGVNFFDNAEVYAGGESERIMGQVIAELGWQRRDYVISSKFFWGIHDGVNLKNTLNRKYLLDAIEGSLERLNLEYVDIAYCHRPDPETTIEETVYAMHDMIERGWALYWGTSEWSGAEIREAYETAARLGLRKPIVEQPQYHLFHRDRVENEYASLYADFGMGLTTWSPLASGLLSGKYLDGIPAGSRGALPGYEWLKDGLSDADRNDRVRQLVKIAESIGCTMAQLAIAWCASNPNVSTVITGASRPEQVTENLAAIDVVDQLTPDVLAEISRVIS
jgi:voltage-dependent potassium channel beta subunit